MCGFQVCFRRIITDKSNSPAGCRVRWKFPLCGEHTPTLISNNNTWKDVGKKFCFLFCIFFYLNIWMWQRLYSLVNKLEYPDEKVELKQLVLKSHMTLSQCSQRQIKWIKNVCHLSSNFFQMSFIILYRKSVEYIENLYSAMCNLLKLFYSPTSNKINCSQLPVRYFRIDICII